MPPPLSYHNQEALRKEVRTTLRAVFEATDLPVLHVPSQETPYRVTANAPCHAYPEIFFQISGVNQFTCGDQAFNLKAGEVCIMPAAVPHAEVGQADDFSAFVIVHDISRILVFIMNCSAGQRPTAYPAFTYHLENGQLLADLLSQTAECIRTRSPVAPHLLRSYLGLILDRIDQATKEQIHSTYSPLVAKCMDIFFAEMDSDTTTLNAVAGRLNCNADSLSARFSREVGQTAIQYLTGLRIEQARKLLRGSSISIAEVGWACGYRDPNYFSRLFKAQVKCTPRQFRKHATPPR